MQQHEPSLKRMCGASRSMPPPPQLLLPDQPLLADEPLVTASGTTAAGCYSVWRTGLTPKVCRVCRGCGLATDCGAGVYCIAAVKVTI